MKRAIFFIDGFNVFHALDEDPKYYKYKWLDYGALANSLVRSSDKINQILYFTAFAFWDKNKMKRHKLLVEAIESKGVKTVLGKFKKRDRKCSLCNKVYPTFEEKLTDVNIAVSLIKLATKDEYDVAYLVSADSDLSPAVACVKNLYPNKEIIVVFPLNRISLELERASERKAFRMERKHLNKSMLPDTIVLSNGKILRRPNNWL